MQRRLLGMKRRPLLQSLSCRRATILPALFRSCVRSPTRHLKNTSCAQPSPSALCTARRCKGYHFFLSLDDPEATRLRVEEDLERLASEEKKGTTAYLHSLLNLTLSHYQRRDFINARDLAEYTHQKALAHNSKSSLLYFTSITCARCADALAADYEIHLEKMQAQAAVSVALAPAPSVVFNANRVIAKLRADAQRYRGIAERVFHRPDMAFMRGAHHGGGGRRGWNSSQRAPGSDTRYAWQDESSNNSVDEEYEPHVYGEKWQHRRKRPEHAEMKHYYKRQCAPSATAGSQRRWSVPK